MGGDTCSGGQEHRYAPIRYSCPVRGESYRLDNPWEGEGEGREGWGETLYVEELGMLGMVGGMGRAGGWVMGGRGVEDEGGEEPI